MDDIRNPPRIESFHPFTIQIVQHNAIDNTETFNLDNIFPFETLFNLKQRITLRNIDSTTKKLWLPSQMFLAIETESSIFQSIEFRWDFQSTFQNPFDATVLGKPNSHIYKHGERVPITPSLFSGITIETALPKEQRVIHIWNLGSIATATGYSYPGDISDDVFFGFLHLYFPMVQSKEDIFDAFEPISTIDTEAFDIVVAHRKYVSERLEKLESMLRSDDILEPPVLNELLDLHYSLPKKKSFGKGFLELKFYEMVPTQAMPFIRFFPANVREMPVTKLYSVSGGISAIENKKLLNKLLDDQPPLKLGSVILIKAPIYHSDAPPGTTWTIRIFEDGSAELSIGAPRKNQPLSGPVLAEAFRILPTMLENTPWLPTMELELSQISAYYKFTSSLEEKPNSDELKKRLDLFLPFFSREKGVDPTAQMNLRYKTVSNYVRDTDPIMDYITTLYLRDAVTSADTKHFHSYVEELIKEFGISRKSAAHYVDSWVSYHSDQLLVAKNKIVFERNIGSAISVYNDHPNYRFLLTNVESKIDLSRILALLTVLTQNQSEILRVSESMKEEAKVDAVITAVEDQISMEKGVESDKEEGEDDDANEWSFAMASRMPHEAEGEEDEEADAEAEVKTETEVAPLPTGTEILKPTDIIASLGEEWYLNTLKQKNTGLFAKGYSRVCQANAGKQPNVMDFATYKRARLFYKDEVFWIESPLSQQNLFLLQFVSSTVDERVKPVNSNNMSISEMLEAEKQALRLGFPLKKDISVYTTIKKPAQPDPVVKSEIDELIKKQKSKPLWTVVRAGSDFDKPNYYLCSELWCVKDNLPLIPSEFEGTVSRRFNKDGTPMEKEPNSCPICGGTILENMKEPGRGQTVVQRKQAGSSKLQKYAGFTKVINPKGFALPCCFADPNNQSLPEDIQPIPKKQIMDDEVVHDVIVKKKSVVLPDKENRNRPFSSSKKGLSSKNDWYIPNQNILGRIVDRWSFLDKGSVSVPSTAVNTLLGQNPSTFLTEKGGVLQGSINSQLKPNAHAFVQYGLGNSLRHQGINLISLLAYAEYATAYTSQPDDSLFIRSNDAILTKMFDEKAIEMFHAFQTANYGSLVHEFSAPDQNINAEMDGEFKAWYSSVAGKVSAGQRAYYTNLYIAWNNFKNYVYDKDEPKDLRLWESLFAQKGLLTKTGFVLVRIIVPKNPNDEARIECPKFGISFKDQQSRPPLLFILQDSVTGLYDPLVLYDGVSKDEKRLLGVLQETMPIFGMLSQRIKEPLQAFLTKYYQPYEGCARTASPIHPWMPVRDATRVPKLGELIASASYNWIRIISLLRDRSNRLVGVIIYNRPYGKQELAVPFYIPCVDDGTILPGTPSVYGEDEDALPRSSLKEIMELLIGKQNVISEHKLAHSFPGLEPARLSSDGRNIIAVELKCGATIPCAPITLMTKLDKSDVHKRLPILPTVEFKDDMPWETDIAILGSTSEDDKSLGQTDEEVLEESYQHLRISISNWLNENPKGRKVRTQIELLRQARKRLPLFELQKRLDILLTPIVSSFLTENGERQPFLLRRDCLQIKKEKACVAGCSWSDGRCLIHTTQTPRYLEPLRVLTARLADELLRTFGEAAEILEQHVSYLKPIAKDQIVKEGDTLMFSAFGRGDESLYDKLGYSRRRPGTYTRALTYPEEVSKSEIEIATHTGLEEWGFQKPVFGADISRDPLNKIVSILVYMTGKSIDEIEREIGPFTGSNANWTLLANMLEVNIIFTEYNNQQIKPAEIIRRQPISSQYIILDPDGIPLLHIQSKKYIVADKDLPSVIHKWLNLTFIQANEQTQDHKSDKVAKKQKVVKMLKPATITEISKGGKLNFHLADCSTLSMFDELIGKLYADKLGSEDTRTTPTGNLKNFGYANLRRMDSSKNSNDCLIHSFLTSVSECFRKLEKAEKDVFASYMRRKIYPELIKTIAKGDIAKSIVKRALSSEFLVDQDIDKLCEYYKCNILIFEEEKSEYITGYHVLEDNEDKDKDKDEKEIVKKPVLMPRCISLIKNSASRSVYMIYNDGGHFEAICNDTGYTIDSDIAETIHRANPCAFQEEQMVKCKFGQGDRVLYKDLLHYVIWRESDKKGVCKKYGLTLSEDMFKEFQALAIKDQGKKANLRKYGSIEASAEDVRNA